MDDFTQKQRRLIRDAIVSGRDAMKDQGADAIVFAKAFIAGRGVQVPGGHSLNTLARRRLDALLLAAVKNGDAAAPPDAPVWLSACVKRELARALSEATLFPARSNADVLGIAVDCSSAADRDACERFITLNTRGGSGLHDKHEIVILPTACDGATLHAIFVRDIPPHEPASFPRRLISDL
jgi:hypothetical protein